MGSSAKKFDIACKTRMGNAMEVSKQLYATIKNILRKIFKGGGSGARSVLLITPNEMIEINLLW